MKEITISLHERLQQLLDHDQSFHWSKMFNRSMDLAAFAVEFVVLRELAEIQFPTADKVPLVMPSREIRRAIARICRKTRLVEVRLIPGFRESSIELWIKFVGGKKHRKLLSMFGEVDQKVVQRLVVTRVRSRRLSPRQKRFALIGTDLVSTQTQVT